LTIEFTRTHREKTPTAEKSTLFSPPSAPRHHWIGDGGCPNILKTLNTDIQLSFAESTREGFAAQPCSYM
jgi:hypothetical protein